jgi:hypothetical protein
MLHRLIIAACCLFFMGLQTHLTHAADTRGLRVVAKDPATNQNAEVTLYNKSYAVIIGIDRYKNLPPDRQLQYAVRDARGVEATLKKHYRFDQIFTLHDEQASRDAIMRLLTSELPGLVGRDDALFIFWAGHGNQVKTDDGELGYLIPYDGNAVGIYGNVTMSQLKDDISRAIPAKHIFYAFDACYSGLLTTRSVDSKPRRDLAYLKNITKERVRQVLTAGSKGQEALDGGPRGHSVFTGRLIEVLEATGDYITANEIQTILKERVYHDARARGHEQTPGFGALFGGGDFVFIPNIQQKVQDNKAELAKIEAELKKLEAQEAAAHKHHNQQKQREAEQQRKLAEAKLKAEQLRQQQLADEQKRQQELQQEQARFEAEQRQREQEQIATQQAEDERLAVLKAELDRKRQTMPAVTAGSITAAVAEIKRLNSEIRAIEATFSQELTVGTQRIAARYEKEIAAVRESSKQQPQTSLVRDEFETAAEFEARQANHAGRFDQRISQLQAQQQQEVDSLQKRLTQAQHEQTKEQRQALQQLANTQFTIGPEILSAELGSYDADKQFFPVSFSSKIPEIKLAMHATIPLPRDAARAFRQQWQAGVVRPQGNVTAGGTLQKLALVNDGDGVVRECLSANCMSEQERLEQPIHTDPQTGLQWLRDANNAGRTMNWYDAMTWVKTLRVGGYTDWRLPTREELEAFVKRAGKRPADYFNANGFNNVQLRYYWSSSTYTGNTSNAWYVYMFDGNVLYFNKGNFFYVWPVRGGQ